MAPTAPRRPTGSSSTPSHPTQASPTPRSVPSPVAARQPAGKTPVNHPTTGSTGSKNLGSTPMMQNLSQTGNISSPSTNLLSFGTPTGLGIEGTTPAGLNLATPSLGGTSMVPTMSELGLTTSSGKRNEDEERRRKMRRVLKSIGKSKGRVSEEGIARVSRRAGFANDIDAEKLMPEDRERKVGNRHIETAGNVVVVEFDLKAHVPQNVQVSFSNKHKTADLQMQGQRAGRVFLNDLNPPGGVSLEASLDRFAMNMERLARMDRLSTSDLNCFAALSGIYTCLCRLYEQEKLGVEASLKDRESSTRDRPSVEVTCRKGGMPIIHANGKIGLEIVYWREGSNVSSIQQEDDKMQIDDSHDNYNNPMPDLEDDNDHFSLRIEAETCPAALYHPLRVSNSWLPDPLELLSDQSGTTIPWQDPPPTFLSVNPSAEGIAADVEQKLPDLRFVAKLDPPLVLPYQTAMNVLSAIGVAAPQVVAMPPSFATLLLGPAQDILAQTAATNHAHRAEQAVLSQSNGTESTVSHSYTLTSAKPDYGFKISELPFSHPRQLIELLPTLRQWAQINLLLKAVFVRNNASPVQPESSGGPDIAQLKLDDLLATPTPSNGTVPVDITLASLPMPTLGITFPTRGEGQVANVNLQVLPNADVLVTNHEGVVLDATKGDAEQGTRLARALDACGDLGVWIEWMRVRGSST